LLTLCGGCGSNTWEQFTAGWHASRFFLRIDALAIDENVERARRSHAQSNWYVEILFNLILEAHGLSLDVRSKETAFDFDRHN
jgi:hypothetical protein